MGEHDVERRQVLRSIGAGALVGGFAGNAAGSEGPKPYIVGVTSKEAANAARSQAARVSRVIDLGTVTAVAGDFPEEAVDALSERADVEYVEEDIPMQALDVEVNNAWGVNRVDAEVAHANDADGDGNNETGGGAHVAIIDSGIDSDHPDLQANLGEGNAVDGYACDSSEGADCNYEWDDDYGHGTHCAGIAAAVDDDSGVVGVSPDATLHAVKVLDKDGSGTASSVAEGINWVANQADSWGPTVASLSLGGGSSDTLRIACENAYNAGVLVVAAAGNDGNAVPPCNDDCISYPAAYEEVIAVTATNRCDEVSNWSSKGPEAELAAPGAVIYSTVPGGGYDTFSGTSMACPHVSGAGAVLMAGGESNTQARQRLRDTAETVEHDSNGSAHDSSYGYGLLDAENAALGSTGGDDLTPIVTTDDAAVSGTDVTLNGHTTANEVYGCADATGSFQYRPSGSTDWKEAGSETVTKDDTKFSTTVTLSAETEYEFRAVLTETASNGWSVTGYGGVESFTTGSGDGGGGGDTTDPSGTIESITSLNPNNPHAEYAVDWTASDNEELATVTVELRRNGTEIVDSVSTSVSGTSASGTTEVSESFGDRNGYDYDVRLVVTDATGNLFETSWQSAP